MNLKDLIIKTLNKKGSIKVSDITKKTGFSRAYISRFFQELENNGRIMQIGKANRAHYVLADKAAIKLAKKSMTEIHQMLKSRGLNEDIVLTDIKKTSGIFDGLQKNVSRILDFAFSEMLNNAIEHSQSRTIEITMKKDRRILSFNVADRGVGIFRHIRKKRHLASDLEAIQDLLKGKQTTAPKEHTGEGIFFTSKLADVFTIKSSDKILLFNNLIGDFFVRNAKKIKGTKVNFSIGINSKRNMTGIFNEYAGGSFEFSKTKVAVKLYKMDTDYISRSQARRILAGLEKFKIIILDFKKVETIGQAFADEVFRVWANSRPGIKIQYKNANENVKFMIKRALGDREA